MPIRQPDEFIVLRTSTPEWHSDQPCAEARAVGSVDDKGDNVTVWAIVLRDLESLLAFVAAHGRCIVLPNAHENYWLERSEFGDWPCIEIYDSYRE